MTGFARATGRDEVFDWTWEVKSVNGRSLDLRCRLPQGMDVLEPVVRASLAKRFSRGHVTTSLQVSSSSGAPPVRVNRALLDELIQVAREYGDVKGVQEPTLDGLMGLRGVIETVDEAEPEDIRGAREGAMTKSLDEVLDGLAKSRRAEGKKLASIVTKQVAEIETLIERVERCAELQPDGIKARLKRQVAEVIEAGATVSEDRLAQELALLATKADIREELERLRAHREAVAHQLENGGTIGRKLDFLAQELNREANTLCAKAASHELSEIGLELKAVIDQFREQVQNIE